MGKKVLKIAASVGGVVVLLALGVTGYGMTLPAEHSFTRSIQLTQPPEKVYQLITNFAAQPTWRPDVGKLERLPDREGKETWRITDTHDISMTMSVAESAPPTRVLLHFTDDSGPANIKWEFIVSPISGGSLVTLRERGTMNNAFFRGLSKILFGTKFADDFLKHLAAKYGQEAVIQ